MAQSDEVRTTPGAIRSKRLQVVSNSDDRRVAVAGDWYLDGEWVRYVVPRIATADPQTRTLLHVGDFGTWPGVKGTDLLHEVDEICAESGITKLQVTPGNQKDWDQLDKWFAERPGKAVRMSEVVWVMRPGYRFMISGVTFMSFGAAVSVDRGFRLEGETWWSSEVPTEVDVVAHSVGGGRVDAATGLAPRADALLATPSTWPIGALADAEDGGTVPESGATLARAAAQ